MTFKENKPIYLQIADRIMDEILQNVYEEEGRILSVREYAGVVEVNAKVVNVDTTVAIRGVESGTTVTQNLLVQK